MPTSSNHPTEPYYFKPGDKVSTPAGSPGTILQETANLFLMRPGRAYEVQLDDGGEVLTFNEHDLERITL